MQLFHSRWKLKCCANGKSSMVCQCHILYSTDSMQVWMSLTCCGGERCRTRSAGVDGGQRGHDGDGWSGMSLSIHWGSGHGRNVLLWAVWKPEPETGDWHITYFLCNHEGSRLLMSRFPLKSNKNISDLIWSDLKERTQSFSRSFLNRFHLAQAPKVHHLYNH